MIIAGQVYSHGWRWGVYWRSKDPTQMHFEWPPKGEPPLTRDERAKAVEWLRRELPRASNKQELLATIAVLEGRALLNRDLWAAILIFAVVLQLAMVVYLALDRPRVAFDFPPMIWLDLILAAGVTFGKWAYLDLPVWWSRF